MGKRKMFETINYLVYMGSDRAGVAEGCMDWITGSMKSPRLQPSSSGIVDIACNAAVLDLLNSLIDRK